MDVASKSSFSHDGAKGRIGLKCLAFTLILDYNSVAFIIRRLILTNNLTSLNGVLYSTYVVVRLKGSSKHCFIDIPVDGRMIIDSSLRSEKSTFKPQTTNPNKVKPYPVDITRFTKLLIFMITHITYSNRQVNSILFCPLARSALPNEGHPCFFLILRS